MKMGDVRDFRNFLGAVIDRKRSRRSGEYLDDARKNATIVQGGPPGDKGYFIEPTLGAPGSGLPASLRGNLRSRRHGVRYRTTHGRRRSASSIGRRPYALTGAVFSRDRARCPAGDERAPECRGELYVNDKPTGAVVGSSRRRRAGSGTKTRPARS